MCVHFSLHDDGSLASGGEKERKRDPVNVGDTNSCSQGEGFR